MIPLDNNPDNARAEFLQKLDRSELIVSDWEAQFLASFYSAGCSNSWFTKGRRASCDKMQLKYGAELKLPVKSEIGNHQSQIPAAAAGCCMYLSRVDGRQQPCNEPAEFTTPGGFLYCRTCLGIAQEAMKRARRTLNFRRIQS